MWKTCAVCGRLVPLGTARCAEHATTPRRRTRAQRSERALVLANAVLCGICHQSLNTDPNDPTVADHIIPLAHGGADHSSNLQAAHRSCNGRKSATLPPSR